MNRTDIQNTKGSKMIYLVIVICGDTFFPEIKMFTNKKIADLYEKKELKNAFNEATGTENKVFVKETPWKNTKKEFILYANHHL